jgi:2-oxoisovalerate dehydrogenase E2 component (dihydrolipoyl transacylase)
MPERHQFSMPDIGEGLTEAEIVSWRVAEGDTVAMNDVIVEVETAKSIVELPSPRAGTVVAIHYPEGATVEVGQPIVTIGDIGPSDSEAPTATAPGVAEPSRAAPRPGATALNRGVPGKDTLGTDTPSHGRAENDDERHTVLVGYGPTRAKVARRPRHVSAADEMPPPSCNNPNQRAYAPPAVRKMARELGIDLRGVPASGTRGQITRLDLKHATQQPVNHPTNANGATTNAAHTRIPIRGVRKHTAEAMVGSAFSAPHVTEWTTVDMTRSLKLLANLRSDVGFAGIRLTPLVLVMRAALLALGRHPGANAKWDAEANEIIQFRDVNLGIAAATPRGLLVPNIRAAQTLTTRELANALNDLIVEAREGKTQPDRVKNGTFTITNIGVFGVDGGTPILNPGEAAILCMGRIREQPWAHKGRVRLRRTTTLALSFDHRLIDGELGSRLLADIARVLENPAISLAW